MSCIIAVPFLEIQGKRFNPATRWWGYGVDGKPMEIDLIAESTDKLTLLAGEVKWSDKDLYNETKLSLDRKCANLPFTDDRQIIKAVFLKEKPTQIFPDTIVFLPDDILLSIT